DHGFVRRCGLYPHSADHAEPDSDRARRTAVNRNDHSPRIHLLWIVDLLSSQQGATWLCPAYLDWQREAQTLAVSLLKGRSARRKPEIATRSGGRWQKEQRSTHNKTRPVTAKPGGMRRTRYGTQQTDTDGSDTIGRGACRSGCSAERAVHPDTVLPDGRVRREWRAVREWHGRLLQPDQRARRRHQRRQASGRGMRDRLRHRQGR